MRMWMVDPTLLCNQHLLGEHVETHMFLGTIRKNVSLGGYVTKGLVQTKDLKARHDALAAEMTARNMNHRSPLEYVDNLNLGKVDILNSLNDLSGRCEKCRTRIKAFNERLLRHPTTV